MKKCFLIETALVLFAISCVAAWQIYVPIHEDNVSVKAYDDLWQYVRVPPPTPTVQLDVPSLPKITPAP